MLLTSSSSLAFLLPALALGVFRCAGPSGAVSLSRLVVGVVDVVVADFLASFVGGVLVFDAAAAAWLDAARLLAFSISRPLL